MGRLEPVIIQLTVKCFNLIGHSHTHTPHSDPALLKRHHVVMGHKMEMEWDGYLKRKTRYSIVFSGNVNPILIATLRICTCTSGTPLSS